MITEANRLKNINEYYFSRKLQEIRDLEQNGKDVINLGIGNPDMMPSENTIDALNLSSNKKGHHGYQSYRGIAELRTAIADWQKSVFNITVDANSEILPLMGSKEGIVHVLNAFINPGDEVLVPNPGYPSYTAAALLAGGKVRNYNLVEQNNWLIDVNELEKQDLSKVKLMWVNYPHMPTGVKGSIEMFKSLVELAYKHNFLLCNDNPYSLILNDNPKSLLEIEGAKEVSLELNSLSKSHNMAGWRIGWVTSNSQYINSILKVKSNMDSGMFLPLQHAAISALNNIHEWHSEQNVEYRKRRELAWHLMDSIGASYSKDGVGMFVWGKISDSIIDVDKFVDELIYQAGVFIAPGNVFGSNGKRFVRVSICSSVSVFEKAIEDINNYLKSVKL